MALSTAAQQIVDRIRAKRANGDRPYDHATDRILLLAEIADIADGLSLGGGGGVWGAITGTLSDQTDLNTALGLKANTASLGTLATQSGTFSGSGTLATGGFTLTVPGNGTAALAGTYSNSAFNATTIGATTPGTGAFTTLTASSTLAVTGASTMAAITSTQLALITTPTDGVLTTNTTAASAGTPVQYSPAFALSGTGWATDSTSSMAVKFRQYVVPAQGTSAPTGKLTWDSSVGGAAAVTRMSLDTLGDLIVTSSKTSTILVGVTGTHFVMGLYGSSSSANSASNRFTLAANTPLGWSNTNNTVSVSTNIDTSIIRSSAGVVEINNGTVGTLRDISLRNLTASGTLATSVAGAASTPAVSVTGAPYTAGSATTNYPLIYANGGTAPTTWSTAGTYFGINAVSGFAGNLIDLRVNGGASVFKVSNVGVVTCTSVYASGVFVATPNTLTGVGAIGVSTSCTGYISTGGAQALTLADGVNGQIKTIIHTSAGGSGVLTPTTKAGYTTITFTNVGDSVTLQFITGTGWCITGIFGAVAA
jgi:hypothetical protein